MPAGPAAKKRAGSAGAAACDPFDALPDAVLQHVLSFLPAQPAVRTCVLARRWRHLWEGVAGLRFTAANAPEPPCAPDDLVSSGELREFVDHLLLLRGGAPLDSCEFLFDVRADADVPHVNLWIRHVVRRCQVRRLMLSISREDDPTGLHFYVDNLPLVSRHLRKLELYDTGLNDIFLDFSGCPGLEDLYISNGGFFHAKRISSKSVKRLSLIGCCFSETFRTRIDVPSVVSLRLEDPWDRTPVIGSMPLLVMAFVTFGKSIMSLDKCSTSDYGDCDDEHCQECYGLEGDSSNDGTANDTNKNKTVLLNGLSDAKSLVLIDESQMYIFKRDLKWCPTFRKLKNLLLNDYWCVPPDFRALACILEHSPVLEKLTLQMFSKEPENKVEIKGSRIPVERSAAISEKLSMVEVNCEVDDERVLEVLIFLSTLNIEFKDLEDLVSEEDGSSTS